MPLPTGKMTKLTSPTGASVSVDEAKADGLVARGFKREEKKAAAAEKAAAKKTAAKKSSSGKSKK